MMRRSTDSGFTLVELLVGLALTGIIMAALFSFFTQGSRVSVQTNSRSEMQQEVLGAQQLIAGRLREAWFVFPTGSALSLGNGGLRRNPVVTTSTGNWTVGTHPILAMILPPRVVGGTCAVPTTEDVPTNANGESNEQSNYVAATGGGNDGCYRFFAYYPVKRSQWLSSVQPTSASHPGTDPDNGDTWILAEYRDHYYPAVAGGAAPVPSTTSPAIPTRTPTNRSKVYLLADYVAPTIPTAGFTTSASPDNRYTMFTYTQTSTTPATVTAVTMNLATVRRSTGGALRLPGATGTYSTTVVLTNQGRTAIQ